MSRSDFLILFDMAYSEAHQNSGLVINDVGKSYQLMKKAGIVGSERRDYLLQIKGDLSRFNELQNIIRPEFW